MDDRVFYHYCAQVQADDGAILLMDGILSTDDNVASIGWLDGIRYAVKDIIEKKYLRSISKDVVLLSFTRL